VALGEGRGDDRERRGRDDRAPEPLHGARDDEHALAGRQAAHERRGGEQHQPGHEDLLAPEQVGGAPAEQQEAGEGERVGVDHHCRSTAEKPRSARIEGSATFTTEMSRMTMNCARQVSARIQRLRASSRVDCTCNDASSTPRRPENAVPMRSTPPEIHELLADRAGEAMALNDRHLNPQLGRIVRTLGFDRNWAAGEGAHLIDERGERYLDLLGGYGVFAIGRNHPTSRPRCTT